MFIQENQALRGQPQRVRLVNKSNERCEHTLVIRMDVSKANQSPVHLLFHFLMDPSVKLPTSIGYSVLIELTVRSKAALFELCQNRKQTLCV